MKLFATISLYKLRRMDVGNMMTSIKSDQGEFRIGGCYAVYTAAELTIGNAHIERTWTIRSGLLYPASIVTKGSGAQWLAKASPYAIAPDFPLTGGSRTAIIHGEAAKLSPVSAEGLRVTVESCSEDGDCRLVYELWVFPAASAVTMQLHAERLDNGTDEAGEGRTNAADDKAPDGREGADADIQFSEVGCVDFMELAPPHLKLRQVEFWDQTDRHNELVFEKEWLLHPNEGKLGLRGNVFVLENTLDDSGLVLIKHAPLPHVRPVRSELDLLVMPGSASFARKADEPPFGNGHPRYPLAYKCSIQGHGTGESGGSGYTYALVAYSGGTGGMTAALHAYQRQWRGFVPERDLRFLSNTWGDRSKDGAIQEQFMLAEVEDGARLGVDVIQIGQASICCAASDAANTGGSRNTGSPRTTARYALIPSSRDEFRPLRPDRIRPSLPSAPSPY
jgi:alpha-galactosidase